MSDPSVGQAKVSPPSTTSIWPVTYGGRVRRQEPAPAHELVSGGAAPLRDRVADTRTGGRLRRGSLLSYRL